MTKYAVLFASKKSLTFTILGSRENLASVLASFRKLFLPFVYTSSDDFDVSVTPSSAALFRVAKPLG